MFVITDGRAQMRPVTVSRVHGDESVIDSGLAPGDVVVTEGQLRLTPNARLHILRGAGHWAQRDKPDELRKGHDLAMITHRVISQTKSRTIADRIRPCTSWPSPGMIRLQMAAMTLPAEP